MISIQLIDTKSPLNQMERELRNKILLRPIGIPDHAWEMHDEKSWHFVAVENDIVIGCVVLVPLNPQQTKAQLMQMAVETNLQGKGIGKLLVNELLSFCKSKGIEKVVCHSRENAVALLFKLRIRNIRCPFCRSRD